MGSRDGLSGYCGGLAEAGKGGEGRGRGGKDGGEGNGEGEGYFGQGRWGDMRSLGEARVVIEQIE